MSSKLVLRLIEVVGVAMLISGCYREEIAELHNQMDDFTEVHINPIEAQISGMNSAIDSLRDTRDALQEQIAALEEMRSILEGRISQTNSDLQELIKRVGVEGDDESGETLTSAVEGMKTRLNTIDQAISDLQTKDAAIDSSINSLKAAVQASNDSLKDWVYKNMEAFKSVSDVLGAIEGDILSVASSLDDFKVDITNAVADSLKSLAERIEMNYNSAISDARNSILNVINDVDSSIRNWVIDTLETSYYDKASIDQFLANIQGGLESKDSIILNKIDSLRDDLAETEQRITDAYGQAITDAVNGIEAKISDLGDIRAKLNSVDSVANATAGALLTLTGRVNTLEQQAEVIKGDIVTLKSMDSTILAKIDSLGGISSDEIDKLKGADTTLQNLIDDLQAYVDGDLTNGFHDWVSQSYATLDRQNNLADSLAAVFNLLGMGPDSLGGWIGAKFNDYFTIAQVTDSLSKLRSELTSNYKSYIADAIENGGIIGKAIADSISAFKTYINGQLDSVKARLTALENVVQSVVFVPEYDDGKIFIPSDYDDTQSKYCNTKVDVTLRFKLNTNGTFDPKNYEITGDLASAKAATKVARRKTTKSAAYAGTKVEFSKIEYSDPILSCTFNTEIIDDSFYDESASAIMSLIISDEKTNISSEFVGLRLQKVAGTGGGTGGGGDEPVGSFRVTPSMISVGVMGDVYEGRVLCASDYTWLIEKIEYSSGSDWVDVQVLKDRAGTTNIGSTLRPNNVDYYKGVANIIIMVAATSNTQSRTATVTFTHDYAGDPERITLKITQEARGEQTVTVTPVDSMKFDWEGNRVDAGGDSYQFTVTPSDQQFDWLTTVEPTSAEAWYNIERQRLSNGAGLVTVTANPRSKGLNSYYSDDHKAEIVIRSKTGSNEVRIPVDQSFRPDGKLIFNPADMEVHFDWDESGSGDAYKFTISPEDQLREWSYEENTDEFKNFDNLFNGSGFGRIYHDSNTGESDMTVYPKAINKDFKNVNKGVVTFVSASGQSTYPMTFIQDVRPPQELEFDKEDTSVDFTWDRNISGTTNKTYEIHVSPKDNQNDWPEPTADVDWIEVKREFDSRTSSSGTVSISIKSSYIEGRSGKVTFKSADGQTAREITVNQLPRPEQTITITSSPDQDYTIPWNANKTYTLVVTSGDNLGDWTCDGGDDDFKDAFTVNVGPWRNNKSEVTINAKEKNTSLSESKTGKLSFTPATGGTPKVFTFTQTPRTAQTLTINPDATAHTFTWKKTDNSTYSITVNPSDDSGDWTCTPDENFEDYFTINGLTNRDGSGNGTITVNVKDNNRSLTDDFSSKLTIASATGGTPTVITFTQTKCPAAQTFANANPADGSALVFKRNQNIRGNSTTKQYDISVTTSDGLDDWTYDTSEEWIGLSKSGGKLTVIVNSENTSGSDRTGTVTIYAANGDATLSYTVTQAKDNLFWSSLTKSTGQQTSNSTTFTLYSNTSINGASKVKWSKSSGGNLISAVTIGGQSTTSGIERSISESIQVTLPSSWTKNTNEVLIFTLTAEDGKTETWKVKITTNNTNTTSQRRYTFEPTN